MRKIIKNKVSLILNPQKNDRTTSSHSKINNPITNSAYSLRASDIINIHKDSKINNNINENNQFSIFNTSPNTKIAKNINLSKALQNITRSSHSSEGILNNKLVNRSNNILKNISTNINNNTRYINTSSNNNNNRHTVSMSNYSSSLTNHQRINFSLTDNAQRMKYQRISIKVNNKSNIIGIIII